MLLDDAESAVKASSVRSKVTIIYPSVSSSEGVDVRPFNHFHVAEGHRLLQMDIAQFLHEVHHERLNVGDRWAVGKFWQLTEDLGGLFECDKRRRHG